MSALAGAIRAVLKAAPIRMWALIGAGMGLTATGVASTLLVWRGGWPESLRGEQLKFIGLGLLANWALIAVVVITLAMVKVKAYGPGGVSLEVDASDDEPRAPAATATATVTVTPPPKA